MVVGGSCHTFPCMRDFRFAVCKLRPVSLLVHPLGGLRSRAGKCAVSLCKQDAPQRLGWNRVLQLLLSSPPCRCSRGEVLATGALSYCPLSCSHQVGHIKLMQTANVANSAHVPCLRNQHGRTQKEKRDCNKLLEWPAVEYLRVAPLRKSHASLRSQTDPSTGQETCHCHAPQSTSQPASHGSTDRAQIQLSTRQHSHNSNNGVKAA